MAHVSSGASHHYGGGGHYKSHHATRPGRVSQVSQSSHVSLSSDTCHGSGTTGGQMHDIRQPHLQSSKGATENVFNLVGGKKLN